MARVDSEFKQRVYDLVALIPSGRVMTYGQIAALCGAAWAAWEVGQLAHFGPVDLPWQRVVNKKGGLARGYVPDGLEGQKRALLDEGVVVSDEFIVAVDTLLWSPHDA